MTALFGPVYAALDDAKTRHHAALLSGDPDAAFAAEFDWASAEMRLAAVESDIGLRLLLGLRMAAKRYPTETADLLDEVFAVRRMMRRRVV